MAVEKKTKSEELGKAISDLAQDKLSEVLLTGQYWPRIQQLSEELAGHAPEEPELEEVDLTPEQMAALSNEERSAIIDLYDKQLKVEEIRKELDRRALKMGLLKLANNAPRCTYLKSNGKPCRAPAMGSRHFCVFHGRSLDHEENPRIKVEILENRESLQLTVKQIMEQIVNGRIEPQTASLLLRAVQIANSTLKPTRIRAKRKKAPQAEPEDVWG